MMRRLRVWAACIGYALMGVTIATVAAQSGQCAPLVAQALESVGTNCTALGRNTVCYGFNRVDAAFSGDVPEGFFSTPADKAELVRLAAIQTAPLDVALDQWGIAVMNVQANVPNTLPGQAVTFLLLGDAAVENAVPEDQAFIAGDPVRVVVSTGQRVNIRSGAGTNFNVIDNADPGQLFDVDARNEAGDWLRISGQAPYQWLARSLVTVQAGAASQLDALPVAPEQQQSPMQAFYFRTGIGTPTCSEAPDLLVVQGPQEVRISLNINGAEVEIGSTVALTSVERPFGELRSEGALGGLLNSLDSANENPCLLTEMTVLEGDAIANDGGLFVPLGHWTQSATCLDSERRPVFTTQFIPPEEMTDAELEGFRVLENLPLPRYDLVLPTREEIRDSLLNGPSVKPQPTRLPRITFERTASSVTQQPGGDTSRPEVSPTPDPNASEPEWSCDGFSVIGPGGAVDAFSQLFAWNSASNSSGYQVEISALDDGEIVGGPKLYRVGSEQNAISVSIDKEFGSVGPTHIRWKIQVLYTDSLGNLNTLCESPYQQSRVVYQSTID